MLWPLPRQTTIDYTFGYSTVNATASATPHTNGSYAQVLASTPPGVTGIYIYPQNSADTSDISNMLLDLAIGGSGSEIEVLSDFQSGYGDSVVTHTGYYIPLRLPEGVRVAHRLQAVIASDVCPLTYYFEVNGGETYAAIDTIGADTAASRGVLVSQDNTTWTEIVASTTNDYDAILAMLDGYDDSTQGGVTPSDFDLGAGTAGNEVVIANFAFVTTTAEVISPYLPSDQTPQPCMIPAGTRLSIRRITPDANNQGLILYGFRK